MVCTMPDLLYDCHSVMLFKLGFLLGYTSDDGEKMMSLFVSKKMMLFHLSMWVMVMNMIKCKFEVYPCPVILSESRAFVQ